MSCNRAYYKGDGNFTCEIGGDCHMFSPESKLCRIWIADEQKEDNKTNLTMEGYRRKISLRSRRIVRRR